MFYVLIQFSQIGLMLSKKLSNAPIINRSRNSKSLKIIYFFFVENRKLRFFKVSVFYVYLRSILFFNLQGAMFMKATILRLRFASVIKVESRLFSS